MKRFILLLFVCAMAAILFLSSPVCAQDNETGWQASPEVIDSWANRRGGGLNFHEDKVPAYRLPDPLVFEDGQPVETIKDWSEKRRTEVLQLFREHVYGIRPTTEHAVAYEVIAERDNVFGIGATAKQIRATVTVGDQSHAFEFVFVSPKAEAPVPVVVLINNRYLTPLAKTVEEQDPFWPVETLVKRGYATASFHTSHVDPDKKDGYDKGVRALLDNPDSEQATRWASLSAWGWGASRVLDYVLQQPMIDAERTAVVGHSRGGKAALWAGAEDPRFKLIYSNNSGCGGAALSRRAFGETVARINRQFPHWFCARFHQYDGKESECPVDQHQLIALLAPRAVYVASADEDLWADPRGEYSALVAAGPVYQLYGLEHIQSRVMPALNQPRHIGSTGYHIREGKHNLNETDWGYFLDFADQTFKR